ncbi:MULTISPECIES: aminoacyl-histidine dipeptidase [unclassified Vibrio]|uniref:Cytosol non-specific dipeptidase n=1 Tax=Vibrio sp. HB236076 TaxID=3232307 RepID=A0AB39H982_9VIBR|nr:aminoacyl-histidine dipeptidase [Vibrio sp. HB161653]MDP5254167.1 aminoacyl-histidine dipeptidase [Vibrio sp. HB161653]
MSEFLTAIRQRTDNPIWDFFDQICRIPRPSKHEQALANYIINWATKLGLAVKQDKTGNLFISKPATPGMENLKGVVLQAHLDMVAQKNEGCDHDFFNDPIKPYIDGDWVKAQDTTLGADNGIGLASCLAVLADKNIKHGPLEVLLTVDEEAGMGGAFGLEAGWLNGEILLNTDSEQEGEVYMGCAGGVDGEFTLPLERRALKEGYQTFAIALKGLRGGHSGVNIDAGRANANKLLARFLHQAQRNLALQLLDIHGGTLRNAIPREAFATVAIASENADPLRQALVEFCALIRQEYADIEPNITFTLEAVESSLAPLTDVCQTKVINLLNACPNGVTKMSEEVRGVVETSLNVGVVTCQENTVSIMCLIRSLIDSGREYIEQQLTALGELAQAQVKFSGAYPGWKPEPNSPIMAIFRDMYQEIYGHKPNIMVIHAGLECGLFKEPYPEMDMLSFGPTIQYPHSPDEQVHIGSVDLYWQQMRALLAAIPAK